MNNINWSPEPWLRVVSRCSLSLLTACAGLVACGASSDGALTGSAAGAPSAAGQGSGATAGAQPTASGGAAAMAGAPASAGSTASGGAPGVAGSGAGGASGGASGAGGGIAGETSAAGHGGGPSVGGGPSGGGGPCDLYAAANTPCVGAHSTVRALYAAYASNLYQVRRASDKTTKDIAVQSPGGYADSATQDTFCTGTTCTISVIYDQSPKGNHLTKASAGGWLTNGGLEANATQAKIQLNGHPVYGVYTTSSFDNTAGSVGYRNNASKGVATGDEPEAMYMVVSGKHYNQYCCFDYGNAETNNKDDGKATMEAVYFGNSTQWGKGSGSGPWVMADLEDGVYAGGSTAAAPTNTSLVASFVTAMLKGPSGNRFVLKGGDAQAGTLSTKYDGARPAGGYTPQKKEGAIILGVGGDNSHTGEGTFFEGCITAGNPDDATDDAVQANIVAAGYGR